MSENLSFEDLVEQFLDYCRSGSNPNVEDFANSHPEHKEELLEILPLLEDLEAIGNSKTKDGATDVERIPDLRSSAYELIRTIGAGGMGVVFEALQLSLERKIAIKLLSRKLLSDKKQREQFENEAKIIALLHHPNIVKIYSAKCTNDCCYYAMELIDGQGLNQCKIYDIKEIAKIALQTAKAVAYAHSCNCLHRDIKPANILLDKDGRVHISDFGLALLLGGKNKLQNIDLKSGTIRYSAPEKLLTGKNDFLTDQYSFGVTFYEVVTKTPFLTAVNSSELANKIKKGKAPKLTCKEKGFSAIINKCMSFNPENRYADMEEVIEELERFLNNEPVKSAQYTLAEKYKLWRKREPRTAIFGLISVICAVLFVLALIIGFVQTNNALLLAKKNADTADATLSKVFTYLEKQPPSASGSVLLDALLPYYREIAKQNSQPKDKIIRANEIVGLYALRSGNFKLAEKSYRKLVQLTNKAYFSNQLALALDKEEKHDEADSIRKNIIDRYAGSKTVENRLEVVKALQSFDDESSEQYAFDIIKSLLENAPSNPEYLFRYALLLGNNPKKFAHQRIYGTNPNAVVILSNLAKDYPENPEYGIAIVELMNKKLKYADNFTTVDWENLETAFDVSEHLLARFPNTPKVVTSVVNLKTSYIKYLRRSGDMVRSRKETEQLLGMLELLFYNPETPDSAREALIDLQLDRLRLFVRDYRSQSAAAMKQKIGKELNFYNGSRLQEFQRRFNNLN